MARGICHARKSRLPRRHGSQMGASQGPATADGSSQRTSPAVPPEVEPPKKRGRKPGTRTKLKPLTKTGRVVLKLSGDSQFAYADYTDHSRKPPYKYTTQLGVLLKREYPGKLEDKAEDGLLIRERLALDWNDYFLGCVGKDNMTHGECVLYEFWRLFEVAEDDQEEANRVLDNYLKKKVRDIMYQARVDCVKAYYRKRGESLDDALARTIELEYEQYKLGRLDWFNDAVWPILCAYWCSEEYKTKRKIGLECRFSSDDIAQNHGGSRNFTETQQVLGLRFGPHKGTPINAFAAMKSGMRNIDSSGNCGPINSSKAQQRMDDYIAGVKRATQRATQEHEEQEEDGEHEGHEEDGEHEEHEDMEEVEQGQGQGQGPEHEQELNAKVLYDVSGGMTSHGHFAIGYGAVRAADIRAVAKENNVSLRSKPVSMQTLARQNAELRRENARLQKKYDSAAQQGKVAIDLTMGLYRRFGLEHEIPEASLRFASAAAAQGIATGSSHVGSESTNDDNAADGHDEDNLNDTNRAAGYFHSGHHA